MKQQDVTVISNEEICSRFFLMQLEGQFTPYPRPGQFVTLRVSDQTVPLLRRPFAFSEFDPQSGYASIIYQKRGIATQILAGKRPHDRIDCIGPLGNAFPLPDHATHCIIVAGGIGIGPMIYWANTLIREGFNSSFIYGCRMQQAIPHTPGFTRLNPCLCTDDGSVGFAGTVIDYLRTRDTAFFNNACLYACGPMPMLAQCHALAQSQGIGCLVSIEQTMACGVGACMGCVTKIVDQPGYARVCKEGPVFESRTIQWT